MCSEQIFLVFQEDFSTRCDNSSGGNKIMLTPNFILYSGHNKNEILLSVLVQRKYSQQKTNSPLEVFSFDRNKVLIYWGRDQLQRNRISL